MFKLILKSFYLISFISLIAGSLLFNTVSAASPNIEVLHVEGIIVPAVANYVNRGIDHAESQGSTACIIELNTPGGLLISTEEIVQKILNAEVPVVVYVSPQGAWAASAGTFITVAAHIAAMAPGSSIGAAHPVSIGEEMPETEAKKVTEYSAAWIRSIAQMRGRDPIEAELAVRESKSYTDTEALQSNLIDLQANDLESLISQLNGKKVTLATGEEVTINTAHYVLDRNEMTGIENFLHAISDPNIAYILLTLATIGLITEFSNPGTIFPGVAGGISLLLAFYSLGVLSAYWGGTLLILLAFGLFLAELFVVSHGLLAAGGIASLTIGSLTLFSHTSPPLEVNRGLIAGVAIFTTAFFIFVIGAVVRAHRRQPTTGIEGLTGKVAVAQTALNPTGTVLIEGERWTATLDHGRVKPGEEVIVTRVEGLKLWVTKKKTK